jgi:hypothetical protein
MFLPRIQNVQYIYIVNNPESSESLFLPLLIHLEWVDTWVFFELA